VPEPVIEAGNALTVTVAVAVEPVLAVKVIVVVPADMPVTTPEDAPIVPTAVLLLDHEPGDEASLSSELDPTQTERLPVIGAATAITVTWVTAKHPPAT
jgi:hypothetical protein